MDSLKTLMDKNQYDLVIKLTENADDATSLFYRIASFVAVGQIDNALNIILTKRDLLKKQLNLLIKFHIETLCLKGAFDEAYQALKYYEELPYENQEVEEILRAMPNYIRSAEKDRYKSHHVDEDELRKRLTSKNEDEVLGALDEIKSLPIHHFLPEVLNIVRSYPRKTIRSFALLLLLKSNYNQEVEFLHFDKIIKVNPSLLPEPFEVPGYKDINQVSNALLKEYKDPTVAQNALQTLASYLLYIYPDRLQLNKNETIVVFAYIAKHLLQIDTSDLESVCSSKKLDYAKISKTIKEIEESLNDF